MKSPCLLKQLWNTKMGVLRCNKICSDIWLSYSFDNEEKIHAHLLNISQTYRGSLALFFKFPSLRATPPEKLGKKALSKKKYLYICKCKLNNGNYYIKNMYNYFLFGFLESAEIL